MRRQDTSKKIRDLELGFAHELSVEVVVPDGGHWSSDREEMMDGSSQTEDFFEGFFKDGDREGETRMARKERKDDNVCLACN